MERHHHHIQGSGGRVSLTRKTYLKARRRRRPDMGAFRAAVVNQPCALIMEGGCEGRLEAHHVIAAQALRKRGLGHLVTAPANGMSLCERHHRRHTLGLERIPFSALSQAAVEFADEFGLRWWLERFYPVICAHCGQRVINRGAHAERCV